MLFMLSDWLVWEEYRWREHLSRKARLWQRICELMQDIMRRLIRLWILCQVSVCPV